MSICGQVKQKGGSWREEDSLWFSRCFSTFVTNFKMLFSLKYLSCLGNLGPDLGNGLGPCEKVFLSSDFMTPSPPG